MTTVIVFLIVSFMYFMEVRSKLPFKKRSSKLNEEFKGKKLFLDWRKKTLYDPQGNSVALDNIRLDFDIHKESEVPTLIPVEIRKFVVQERYTGYDEAKIKYFEIDCVLQLWTCDHDFKIVYCGDFDAIAKSQQLGEICLAKKKYTQFEIGKKLSICFNAIQDTYEDGPWIIKPQIA